MILSNIIKLNLIYAISTFSKRNLQLQSSIIFPNFTALVFN